MSLHKTRGVNEMARAILAHHPELYLTDIKTVLKAEQEMAMQYLKQGDGYGWGQLYTFRPVTKPAHRHYNGIKQCYEDLPARTHVEVRPRSQIKKLQGWNT